MAELKCPICSSDYVNTHSFPEYKNKDGTGYVCAVCGPFFITRPAEINSRNQQPDPRFPSWIRGYEENQLAPPFITSNLLEEVAKNLPNYSPLEKQLILLRAIERRTKYPGFWVVINDLVDYPLAWATNSEELDYLLKALEQRNFVERSIIKDGMSFTIRPEGWEHLDQIAGKPAFSNQTFIAMSFNKEMNIVWTEGIKPAVERAGYKPVRVDKEPHIDRIDAKIISEIKDALFIVADVTGQKQGVYFEAGFALGLKRPVIWCVREDDFSNVHFDTRQYNHIVYKEPKDLQEQLYNVICAVIGLRRKAV